MKIIYYLIYLIVMPLIRAVQIEDIAEEIQHAVCRIASEEINATANATITRQLKGVCTSSEFNRRMNNLEQSLLHELAYIKQIVHRIIQIAGEDVQENDIPEVSSEQNNEIQHQNILTKQLDTPKITETNTDDLSLTLSTTSTSLIPLINGGIRKHEIDTKNMSIKDNGPMREFTYFWKIDNILELLANDVSIVSQTIYIEKRKMNIKMHVNHLSNKYVAFELTYSTPKKRKPHEFTLINQKDFSGDLKSQLLGDYKTPLYRVSTDRLGSVINNNTIILKLTAYI